MRAIFRRTEKYSISGGTIYDLAIAQAGIKVQVDRIVTLNDRHFKLFGPDVAKLLIIS
ncbi:hypothetical protein GKIL_2364 [Gloeobacter kilaueensis JS1]|uniref:PIN domain-containing protein n=1 Tax=Gloeobacter kilaueensis (strain ATCC BAA-2537 / CCAP 1431/1 / ULC 316 / JS1) TaxID=1183438 RepID=U5QLP5_GLOK1|nr:hypothetical protein GKIL_2364 [Gloeobacter kilaueensis JS1]